MAPVKAGGRVIIRDQPWRDLKKRVEEMGRDHVRVGVLASKGGDAPAGEDGITLVELAAIHEFGSPAAGVPERSFIRRTVVEQDGAIRDMQGKLAKAVVLGRMTVERALGMLGAFLVGAIRRTITQGDGVPPPLKDATIARKGSTRPLVDTGRLLGSITYEVAAGGTGAADALADDVRSAEVSE